MRQNPERILRLLLALLPLWLNCAHAEKADREQPINLEADTMKLDDAKQVSIFEGHVQLTQGTMFISADHIVVTKSTDGSQHMVATGAPANFRQRQEGSDEYVEGYGEKIEYDTREDIVDLFGNARVKRGQDEVLGEHITYNSKTEVFEARSKVDASGQANVPKDRVRAVIQPKKPKPAAAPAKPAEAATNQPLPAIAPH